MKLNLRHRKRYGPVATRSSLLKSVLVVVPVSIPQAVLPSCNISYTWLMVMMPSGFNTASGITQLQRQTSIARLPMSMCFNTASGITQLQPANLIMEVLAFLVSIPQAVLPSCNRSNRTWTQLGGKFQYRKRYYPVATDSASTDDRFLLVSIPQAVLPSCN